jgi:hypothetical protein
MVCRHCHQGKVNRPRGLCWTCYYRPGIREQYPSTSKFARRGVGNFISVVPMPTRPTAALPGSAEKLAVLEERARLNQALWHPEDASVEGGIVFQSASHGCIGRRSTRGLESERAASPASRVSGLALPALGTLQSTIMCLCISTMARGRSCQMSWCLVGAQSRLRPVRWWIRNAC